jgi:hypothetical protein
MASPTSFIHLLPSLLPPADAVSGANLQPSFKTATSHLPLGLPMAYLRIILFDFCKELITYVQISHLRK